VKPWRLARPDITFAFGGRYGFVRKIENEIQNLEMK
jgi:hypothetical protein